jgi:hypothetical protein
VCSGAFHQALHGKIFRQCHIANGTAIRLSLEWCSTKEYSSVSRGQQGETVVLKTKDIVFKNESRTCCLQSPRWWQEMITELQMKFGNCNKSVTYSSAVSLKSKQSRYINCCSYFMCGSPPPKLCCHCSCKKLLIT